jgi:GH15 family glucan-1,4-alpha-glucosidase
MSPIKDYAIVGDGRSAALVSRRGSIDWLCWPRFDSASLFGAILDERAGFWRIAPAGRATSERRYVDDSNVLETTFRTDRGRWILTDLMPAASEREKGDSLEPEREILRRAQCLEGEAEVEMVFAPRPGYGRERPRLRKFGEGCRVETSDGTLFLRTRMEITNPADATVVGRIVLRAGQSVDASLSYAIDEPAILVPLGPRTDHVIARTVRWWKQWVSGLKYEGPCREDVVRSALALKLLVFAPSGAVIAAPTTSLPERIGGDLNWDYRYTWLRDASMTVRAMFHTGFEPEGAAFVAWLLHATRLTRPELRILYDVYGNRPPQEHTLELAGHCGSKPVRLGNAADEQLQLDVYGEVIDAATHFAERGGSFDGETRRMLRAFGLYVCRHWQRPDEGIWEPRSGRSHHTHSRLLCWTALDRLLALHRTGRLPRIPLEMFEKNRAMIRREIEERAWNPTLGTYAAVLGGTDVDATALLLPWYGFESASSPRMQATYRHVVARLGAGGGLLYRYRNEDAPKEGAFGICSFWGVEFLAMAGRLDEAEQTLRQLCGHRNDVGLFGEQIDPETGDALGNFPQGFTHVGLVNAALTLQESREKGAASGVRGREELRAMGGAR